MKTSILLAGALLAAPAFAQGGDDCSTATAIGATGALSFDTTAATTSGFNGTGTCATGADTINQDLFWQFTAPAAGNYRFDTFGSTFDTKLSIHTGVGCAAVCADYNDDTSGLQSEVEITGVSAGDQILVQVGGFGTNFGAGTLNIGTFVDPCPGGVAVPDAFEPNDTCPTAAAVTPGSYTLTSDVNDTDFFTITLAPGELLDVTIGNDFSIGDVDHNQFDGSCMMTVGGFGSFSVDNTTGAPLVVTWEEFYDPTSPETCLEYTMDVSVRQAPCQGGADSFEPNTDCATAAAIADGTYPGLNVEDIDNDYYEVVVPDGGTLDVDISFVDADGDVDLFLWDPAVACDSNVVPFPFTGSLDFSRGVTDSESVTYTNITGASQTVIIEVDMFTVGACNDYSMTVSGGGGVPTIGTSFCMANNNSTGLPGLISATGSTSVVANDVTLNVDQIPALQFGIFVVSATAGSMTPVNSGILCLSGQIGRYDQAGFIWQADANGQASRMIDLLMVPTPNAFVATLPGDTWFFQAWHRDIPSGNSNFTTGVEITFN